MFDIRFNIHTDDRNLQLIGVIPQEKNKSRDFKVDEWVLIKDTPLLRSNYSVLWILLRSFVTSYLVEILRYTLTIRILIIILHNMDVT